MGAISLLIGAMAFLHLFLPSARKEEGTLLEETKNVEAPGGTPFSLSRRGCIDKTEDAEMRAEMLSTRHQDQGECRVGESLNKISDSDSFFDLTASMTARISRNWLTIRASKDEDDYLLVRYIFNGREFNPYRVRYRDIDHFLGQFARDFAPVQHRFGLLSITPLKVLARDLSHYLLSSEIRSLLSSAEVDGIQVLVGAADPSLPWNFLYDDESFIALRIPITLTPISDPNRDRHAFSMQDILVIESAPDSYGFDINPYLAGHLSDINLGDVSVARHRADSFSELEEVDLSKFDVIHWVVHSITDPHLKFVVGDCYVTGVEFCSLFSAIERRRLVILDSCLSAISDPDSDYPPERNPSYLLSYNGIDTIGAEGWIDLETSDEFSKSIYQSLAGGSTIADAVFQARLTLAKQGKQWWTYVHYGQPG